MKGISKWLLKLARADPQSGISHRFAISSQSKHVISLRVNPFVRSEKRQAANVDTHIEQALTLEVGIVLQHGYKYMKSWRQIQPVERHMPGLCTTSQAGT